MIEQAHHIKALPPALAAMSEAGFSPAQCLAGTGLEEEDLLVPASGQGFSLEQQFRFHRNLLALTGNPLLGLELGRRYTIENYGLLGYAFMSAPTLRHALTIIRNYGPLSFTLFKIDFQVSGNTASLRFSHQVDIPPDLITYYVDRDITAALFGGSTALQAPLQPAGVRLMHDGGNDAQAYRSCFNCPVEFNGPRSELLIDAGILDSPMPLRDPETSTMCQQQCQLLLARMSKSGSFIHRVRQLIVARPGYFPDIEYVAERLNMTSRTLRRRLAAEQSSFQQILSELRYELAREYLGTSTLPVEEISALLGYSSPGNFTNAFRRWHGSSPRDYRKENQ
jgi:AraC-like DNA-binding protein